MIRNRKSYIILIGLVLVVFFMLFQLFLGKDRILRQQEISAEIAEYKAEIDSLNHVIEERNKEIERLTKDSLYKEELLRTRYGMSRKEEKVFRMVK